MPLGLNGIMNKPTKLIMISILHLLLLGCDIDKGVEDLRGVVLSAAGAKPNTIKQENMEHMAANPDYPFVATAIPMNDKKLIGFVAGKDPIMNSRGLASCTKWGKPAMRTVDYADVTDAQVGNGEVLSLRATLSFDRQFASASQIKIQKNG